MAQVTGKQFASLLDYTLTFPLFIEDVNKGDDVHAVLSIQCFDPDKKAEQKHYDAVIKALEEPSIERRIHLMEKATNEMEKANYQSYSVGTISYKSVPQISSIKAVVKVDGEEKELIVRDGESLEGLFNFLEDVNRDLNKLVSKK